MFTNEFSMLIRGLLLATVGMILYSLVQILERGKRLLRLGEEPGWLSEEVFALMGGVKRMIAIALGTQPETIKMKQIFWVGRLTLKKGVEYLLKDFQIFSQEFPYYSLVMAGRGPLKDDFVRMIRETGLGNRAVFRSFILNGDLPCLYQESLLFALPSLKNGVSRTILEAMACGRPAVCTALPQLVDIVSGYGMLIFTEDAGAVADALSMLVSDPVLARNFGQSARAKVASQYSWDGAVAKTPDLYTSLAYPVRGGRETAWRPEIANKPLKAADPEQIDRWEQVVNMKISIIGYGCVSAVTGVCFADLDNDIVFYDIDTENLDLRGKSPIYERSLDDSLNVTPGILTKRNTKTTPDQTSVSESKFPVTWITNGVSLLPLSG